jgi:carboxymethylenebutenolidase
LPSKESIENNGKGEKQMGKAVTEKIVLQVADGTPMNAFVARPAAPGKYPGMLVFQEAFGVNAHIRDVTERIAGEGYVAIAPELYHRTAPGFEGRYDDFPSVMPHARAVTDAGASDDIRAAFNWLQKDSQVVGDRIASIGFCMGGRISFLACATVALRAAISFYGGGIAPALLPRAAELKAPVLFFWGGLDKHIPAEQIRAVVDGCRTAGKAYVNVEISDADHGFFCDARASYNPAAAKEAWSLVLAFLDTHVKDAAKQARSA